MIFRCLFHKITKYEQKADIDLKVVNEEKEQNIENYPFLKKSIKTGYIQKGEAVENDVCILGWWWMS